MYLPSRIAWSWLVQPNRFTVAGLASVESGKDTVTSDGF
jgi:hypothetical protein